MWYYITYIMGKFSLKTILCAVFCAWGVLGLGGCTEPVSLSSFVADEDVLDIIDKGSGLVSVTPGSDLNLTAGNKKISGLDPGKYYMVEEWDQNGTPVGVQFVAASGERSADLANIGAVSGGEITGLTNSYNYRVKSAGPLSGDVSYSDFSSSSGTATNSGGTITLPGPTNDDTFFYILTPMSLSLPSFPHNSIAEVSVSPARSTRPANRTSNNIVTSIGQNTVVDYVFFQSISGSVYNFYVLRVTSDQNSGPIIPGVPGNITINVTLSYTPSSISPQTSTTLTYPQSDTGTKTITVSNASQYDDYAGDGIKWYIGNTQEGTGQSLSLNIDQDKCKIIGKYTITVEAKIGTAYYSTAIEVEVTSP